MPLQQINYTQIRGGAPNVKDFGAKGDGITDDTAAIQSALNIAGNIYVPTGTYKITSSLTFGDRTNIVFDKNASFIAGVNNLTFFLVSSHAYFSQIRNAKLNGNGFTGITGFDLTSMRLQAGLYDCYCTNMDKGLVLRSACFGIEILNFTTYNGVPNPIQVLTNNSATDIHNPNLDNFSGAGAGTGIGIYVPLGADANTGVTISGGYIQGFDIGVKDEALATKIENTYFEGCATADILFNGARNSTATGTVHSANIGIVALKSTNSDAITVLYPMVVSGARSTGVFDFNGTNTNCSGFIAQSNASYNSPIGVITGILVSGKSQFFNITDASGASLTFTQNKSAYWTISNNVVTISGDITYPVTADVANTALALPIPAKINSAVNGCVGYTNFGAVITMYGSSSVINFYNFNGGVYTNANLSGKRVGFSITYIAN